MNEHSAALLGSRHDLRRLRWLLTVLILSAGLHASAAESPCPADRPVDDIIAEVSKQTKQNRRADRNPLPQAICIGGWCRQAAKTPPIVPHPPRVAVPPQGPNDSEVSSSRSPAEKCNEAMELALAAAHDVEVGDYSFQEKNYRGALLRYQAAAGEKALDIAIHVRLGRVFEKLNELPEAIEQYKAAEKLTGPEKWSDEARASLTRLQNPAQR